jgi:hypothetical protein
MAPTFLIGITERRVVVGIRVAVICLYTRHDQVAFDECLPGAFTMLIHAPSISALQRLESLS